MIKLGRRYMFVSHPHQPTGVVRDYDAVTDQVLIAWDDPNLFPLYSTYAVDRFLDGTFALVEDEEDEFEMSASPKCKHLWQKYVGLREVYEYCGKCSTTRPLDES